MTLSKGFRRTLIALVAVALIAMAAIASAPLVVKRLTLNYLEDAGVQAEIDNVDANLFTGEVEYDNAHGRTEHGDGFEIGHLAINLNYLPLFSHQLSFSRIALGDARIDLHRTRDDALRVAGIQVLGGPAPKKSTSAWGFGLQRLSLSALKLVYTQPGTGDSPQVERVLSFNPSSASDVVTWQPDKPVPIDADMTIADSRIKVKGEITPFGQGVTARFDLMAKKFPLDLLAPVAQTNTLTRLSGTVDTDSHITANYRQQNGLTLAINGQSQWQDSRMTFGNGPDVHSDTFGWNGEIAMALLRPKGKAGHVDTDGKIRFDNLKASQADWLTLTQANGQWQGTANARLGDDTTTLVTDGDLSTGALDMDWGHTLTFKAGQYHWQGKARFIVGELFAQRFDGQLSTRDARLAITGSPLVITADQFSYAGFFRRTPDKSNKILTQRMNGTADARNLVAQQTAIGAPWIAADNVQIEDFALDRVDDIRFARLATKKLRLLGDTNSSVSVLAAPDTSATDFRLTDLRRYAFDSLDINRPEIHLRRSATGLGVLSEFFGGSGGDKTQSSQSANAKTTTTYAVNELKLSNGQLTFVDTAVNPNANLDASQMTLAVDGLDTADPERDANYRLSASLGRYGQLDSQGKVAPLSTDGADMNITARMRSLAMAPLSGYMNAAMGRGIARGSTDADLDLKANNAQLEGTMDVSLSNFRLAGGQSQQTEVALGVSLDTALSLVRNDNDVINFSTGIVGDIGNPQFAIKNLVREAIFAGLRAAVTSVYSPLGLLSKAGEAISNIGQALSFHPIAFKPGAHGLSDDARDYLSEVGTAMSKQPDITLTLTGHAVPADADKMSFFGSANVNADNRGKLAKLARARAQTVRDYLAARDIAPERLPIADPAVEQDKKAKPQTTFALGK